MTKIQFIPPVAGDDLPSAVRWMRNASNVLNEFMRQMSSGAFFVWSEGCINVPTNTDINGARELIFESPFTGNGTLVVTGVGFEGGVTVALNDTELGTLSNANTTDPILYEVQVDNLIDGLNSFKIWSTSADTGELRKLEAWRNFSRELIDTAGGTAEWGSVTGAGKPEDNADVTADHANDIIFRQSAAPSSPQEGWLWQDTDDLRVYRRTSGAWVQVGADDALLLGLNAPAESGADATVLHADDIVFSQSSAPGSPQPGWLWHDTDDDNVYRRNAANTLWVFIGSADALELLNAPAAAGADVTGNNTANDVNVGGGRNVDEAGADQTTNNLLLKGDANDRQPMGAELGVVDNTNVITGDQWITLRSFTVNFTGTFRLMVEARFVIGGTGASTDGWRLKNGAGSVVHTESTLSSSYVEYFSGEETVSSVGETFTIEGRGGGDGINYVNTYIRDTEVRARFDHVVWS